MKRITRTLTVTTIKCYLAGHEDQGVVYAFVGGSSDKNIKKYLKSKGLSGLQYEILESKETAFSMEVNKFIELADKK